MYVSIVITDKTNSGWVVCTYLPPLGLNFSWFLNFWGLFFFSDHSLKLITLTSLFGEKSHTPSPLSSLPRQSQHPLEQRHPNQDDPHIQLLLLPLNLIKWTLCWTLCWLSLFICLINSALERHPTYCTVEKSATVNIQKMHSAKRWNRDPYKVQFSERCKTAWMSDHCNRMVSHCFTVWTAPKRDLHMD